jgi:tRNA-specific 2-thiouridylase
MQKKNEIIVGPKKKLIKRKIRLKKLNLLHENNKELENELFVKVRSTGKLIKAKVELDNGFANVDLQEDEYGISPGQACVFYLKNKEGYKVLGGGWITK